MSTGRKVRRPHGADARRKGRGDVPIWARPAPGQRQPRLSREQIAALALSIADAEGFEAVSMRRLATELGVGTMTLYYYVRTKDDLVALMDDALMGEVVIPEAELPRGWRAGLAAIARRSRDVFVRHPWALRELEGARIGPNGMRHMEQSVAIAADLPLDRADQMAAIALVDDFVFGYVLRSRDSMLSGAPDLASIRQMMEFARAQLATGSYPRLSELVGDDDPIEAFTRFARELGAGDRFERGLAVILDGIEQLIARRTPARPRGRQRARRGATTTRRR